MNTRIAPDRAPAGGVVAAMTGGWGHGCVAVRCYQRAGAEAAGTGTQFRVRRAPDRTEQTSAALLLAANAPPGESPVRYAAVNGCGARAVYRAGRLVAERLGRRWQGPGDQTAAEGRLVPLAPLALDPEDLVREVVGQLRCPPRYSVSAEAHTATENRLLITADQADATETLSSGAVVVDLFEAGRLAADADLVWSGSEIPDPQTLCQSLEQALRRTTAPRRPAPPQVQLLLVDGTAGVLLHEACGHLLESTRERPSLLAGRRAEQVAYGGLSVADNPRRRGAFGGHRYTMLGLPTRRRPLLASGRLTGLLEDTPDGPWRAGSARHVPQPRMSHLEVTPARDSAPMDNALEAARVPVVTVHRFGPGSLNHRDGTVVLEVKDAIWHAGRRPFRLEPFLVTAEARHMLLDIRAVGDPATMTTWSAYCQAASGRVPVGADTPSMLTGPLTARPLPRPPDTPLTAPPSPSW